MNRAQRRAMRKPVRNKANLGLTLITTSSLIASAGLLPASANGVTTCNASNLSQLQEYAESSGDEVVCDVINVTNNISFGEGAETILVDHAVTIQGNVTIDGNKTGSIFEVDLDFDPGRPTVTFRGLNLINGGLPLSDFGAAEGFLYFSDAAIGGAIYVNSEVDVVLDGVDFNNNSAAFGGAVGLFEGARLFLQGEKSNFSENTAYWGGAIGSFLFGNSVYIQNDSTFDSNQAIAGGAIADFGVLVRGLLNIDGAASFTNNSAFIGGAIVGAELDISGAYFGNNEAVLDLNFLNQFDFEEDEINPALDDAPLFGGAIAQYTVGFGEGGAAPLTIENSTFFQNHADFEGGAIWANSSVGSVISQSTFLDNTSATSGDEIPGQSIYGAGILNLFGNIFASSTSDLPHLGVGVFQPEPEVEPEFIDLGGNIFTTEADQAWLASEFSQRVLYTDLKIDSAPVQDGSYPNSAPVIPIANTSAAADAINFDEIAPGGIIILGLAEGAPIQFLVSTLDQRGASRIGKHDAGAYEVGDKQLISAVVVKKVILPSAPARVSAKHDGRKTIKIDWATPITAGTGKIIRYEIYRNGKLIANLPSSTRSFRDTKLDLDQSYTYRIVTVGSQGKSIKSPNTSAIFPRR